MKRVFLLFPVLILVLACGRNPQGHEGKQIFRYNESSGISSLDPAFARDQAMIWACNQLYNGLVQIDDSLNVLPCIARSWEISADGKLYTFFLRNDVYFHPHSAFISGQGRQVTASDFVYSFNRIIDSKTASPGAWVFSYVDTTGGNAFVALNDTLLQIRLKQAFPPFAGILSMQYCSVIPREVVEAEGMNFRKRPIGTGPFRFKYWKEGVKLVLLRNENYFETDTDGNRLPYLDAVNISFIIDKQSAFLEFVKGNLDFLSGLDPSYKDEVLTRSGLLNQKYSDRFKLLSQPYLNIEYLGIRMGGDESGLSPLQQKNIRKAINYGFERDKMLRYLRNNIGTPGIYGMIPPGLPSFHADTVYDYRPELAARLLAEAGFPGGKNLPEITLTTTPSYLDLCIYLQNRLQQLGIRLKVESSPPASLREMVAQGKVPFFRASWIADYPDAENYLSLFFSPNHSPAGPNYTRFTSTEFDKLYRKASLESNDSIRYDLYRKMNEQIMEEAPVVILYYDRVLRFVQNNIEGIGTNPLNLLTLKSVRKSG